MLPMLFSCKSLKLILGLPPSGNFTSLLLAMKSLSILAILTLPLAAQNIQPWSGYAVHDESRPHPKKIETTSITTTPAPADADIIFDGKNTDAFTKAWPIIEGILIADKLGDNQTKKSYGSCQLHLEWKIPAGRAVKGQGGGNSGVFLMNSYEVQIQESHTNVTYADGQAGAIYGQFPPLVNPSRPQGEWQSYDITFTAPEYKDGKLVKPAVITVMHNGIIIHNAQELKGPTTHKTVTQYPTTHPEKAPIRLQFHGDPIEFRNIWVREIGQQQTKAEN
jgi:hypothetical protein